MNVLDMNFEEMTALKMTEIVSCWEVRWPERETKLMMIFSSVYYLGGPGDGSGSRRSRPLAAIATRLHMGRTCPAVHLDLRPVLKRFIESHAHD